MKLRLKILSGFLILALMLLIAGVWSIHQLTSIGTSVQQLLDDNYRSITASDTMLQALERQDSGTLLLLMGKWEEGRGILDSAEALFEKGFHTAQENLTIPGEGDYVDRVRSCYEKYRSMWVKPIVGTDKEGNLNWYFSQTHTAFVEAVDSVNALKSLNERTLYNTALDLKTRSGRAVMPGIVAIVSAFAFSCLFTYLVNHFMITPIVAITRGVEAFTQDRKSFEARIETKDEIADLAKAVSKLCATVMAAERGK